MSGRLSVCFLTGEFPPGIGGVGDYTALLASHLAADGCDVAVVAQRPAGTGEDGRGSGGEGGPRVHWVSDWGPARLAWLARLAREQAFDVVHLQYQAGAFARSRMIHLAPALLRRLGAGAEFVTTFHDLRVPSLFPKAGPLRALAVRLLVRGSDGVVFTHPADLVRSGRKLGATWIPIGANVIPRVQAPRTAAREQWRIGPDEIVIGFFGFVNANKGVDALLEAAGLLRTEGMPIRLLFVGDEAGTTDATNATSAARARATAARIGIDQQVTWTGPLAADQISVALSAATLAVLPYSDGASLRRGTLLACLAHGLPVVTTTAERLPKVPLALLVAPFDRVEQFELDDSVAAFALPDNSADLGRAIRTVVNDPERAAELRCAGPVFVEKLGWPRISHGHRAFYERVMERRGATA